MKKRFIAKQKNKRKKGKFLCLLILFTLTSIFSFNFLKTLSFEGEHKELMSILLSHSNHFLKKNKKTSLITKAVSYFLKLDIKKPSTLLYTSYPKIYKNISNDTVISKEVENVGSIDKNPKVYIYNTHQREEYKPSSFLEYSVSPNVMLASYILKEQLDKAGLETLVEERNVQDELNRLGKKYYYSYQISRNFMEDAKNKYPTLTYFIDVHRDSVPKNLSYLEKDGKGYAKVLFIVGLENKNYQANYDFTKVIFDKLESKVPGITRSILQKEGEGVDGVYNQDFSANTILVEIGGYENTVDEVYNTTLVLSEVLKEVMS